MPDTPPIVSAAAPEISVSEPACCGQPPRFGAPACAGPVPSPPPGWNDWSALMHLALCEAEAAVKQGEVPVGALVVSATGELLARAHNRCIELSDPTAHAEVLALRAAGEKAGNYRLEGAVLVCTLEPCCMCAGALVHARVDGLVYGATDLRAGAITSQLNVFEQPFHSHRVWHMPGVLAEECAALLHAFFRARR